MHTLNPIVSTSSSDAQTHSDEKVILASSRPKKRAGRKKFKETRHPIYRGVRKKNSNNKWVCEVREPKKKSRIWLGTFPSAEMAARAHDVAALALRGQLACLNFADSVSCLPVPVSKKAEDIRRAAVKAAEAFRPRECDCEGSKDCVGVSSNNGEAMFDLPRLILNMAEGPLLSPPACLGGGLTGFNWDDHLETDSEVSLWSFSI